MRVNRHTKTLKIFGNHFLFNSITGAIDEVDDHIVSRLQELEKRGSFSARESGLREPLINQMIERGHITYYCDTEEADEISWLKERLKEKAKKENKTASLLLDSFAGRNWCFSDERNVNVSMNREEYTKLLNVISAQRLATEVDLWLIIRKRTSDLEWMMEQSHRHGLTVSRMYTVAVDRHELDLIKDRMKGHFSLPVTVNVKYRPMKFGYLSFSNLGDRAVVMRRRMSFLGRHPFFCPFIYKTFLVDKAGRVSYCPKEIGGSGSFPKRNAVGRINVRTGQLSFTGSWSKEMLAPLCGDSAHCDYSLFCNKMCPYLRSLYAGNIDEKKCGIVLFVRKLMEEEIKNIVRETERHQVTQ